MTAQSANGNGNVREVCLSFRITKDLNQRIAAIAAKERRTMSDMIRVALEDWAVSYERQVNVAAPVEVTIL